MSDLQRLDSTDPDETQNVSRDFWVGVIIVGAIAFGSFVKSFVSWGERMERGHHRAQLLAAYRRRHAWKKSDIPHLESLGVNRVARNRMAQLAGKGRPVVKPHQPFDEAILTKVSALAGLVGPDASADERKRAFKLWPWWPHYVEALYRGEHAIAKEQGAKGTSTEAEMLVGKALGISAATVHSICGEIRRQRKEDEENANFPTMTLAEYESWVQNGLGERVTADIR